VTPENKEKLAINVANSGKMLSVWFMGIVSALAAGYAALPAVCDPAAVGCFSQATLLDYVRMLGVPAPIIAFIVFGIGYYLRVRPQAGITPEVAAAKSAGPDTISEPHQDR
jgi:hypothetical protein